MKRKTSCVKGWMRNSSRLFLGVVVFLSLLFGACPSMFEPPQPSDNPKSLVHISINDLNDDNPADSIKSMTRTIQPGADDIAGYRLTFSGSNAPDHVDITGRNYADVYLADGVYTVTAKAYKTDGEIGNPADESASGSISLELDEGEVISNGGIVEPIILEPSGSANGMLDYKITTLNSEGYLKLFEIDETPLSAFEDNGVLTIAEGSSETPGTVSLPPARYIAEIELIDGGGKKAFLREAIVIWSGVTTKLVYAPDVSGYLDPAGLANSGASLSPTTTIGGVEIGAGIGTGLDEANAMSYAIAAQNRGSVSSSFIFNAGSGYANISMIANTGALPNGEGYGTTPPTDFRTNNVLWVKIVSEDTSVIRYYKFTILSQLSISGDSGYSYPNTELTITENGTYSIGMNVVNKTDNIIRVSSGVTAYITLTDVNIESGSTPFIITSGGTAYLTVNGANVLRTTSTQQAGLGVPNGATLEITAASTGSLEAASNTIANAMGFGYGGGPGIGGGGTVRIMGGAVSAQGGGSMEQAGAGIGGYSGADGGAITIGGGTVSAQGGHTYATIGGAGIGGGLGASGGTITITGGTVRAYGYSGAAGIGGGRDGGSGTIAALSGNAVVFASSIQPAITGSNATQAIVFNGLTGTMYGNVILAEDLIIPANYTLPISSGSTLTISSGKTLTNNGFIYVESGGAISGTVIGNQPKYQALTVAGGALYTYAVGQLTITGNGTYTIGMVGGVSSSDLDRIVVASGVNANITLNEVNIDVSAISDACAFNMDGATVNLTLTGANTLKSGANQAGLQVPSGATITVNVASTGSLQATGGQYGAGIGGFRGFNPVSGGTITINGGTITATGGQYGPGIGGGGVTGNALGAAAGGNVTISGGTVTATGGEYGAGIGGGGKAAGIGGVAGAGGSVKITGGTVTATGGWYGAGIGGGGGSNGNAITGGTGGTVTISGGMVTATGSSTGVGIGGGSAGSDSNSRGGSGGTVIINGGTVIATAVGFSAGIGGAGGGGNGFNGGVGGTVTISGGMVTANGGECGIGGGRWADSDGTITALSGNAVVFASSIRPTLTAGDNATRAIVFKGNNGTMYGNVILGFDVTIPSGKTLDFLSSSQTLTIPSTVSLTNEGTINKNGGTITGTVGGGGTINN